MCKPPSADRLESAFGIFGPSPSQGPVRPDLPGFSTSLPRKLGNFRAVLMLAVPALAVLVVAVLVVAALGARSVAAEEGSGVRVTPPNIVLIFADDLGYGNVGAYGQDLIQTPRLDAMAAGGLRLTDFYAGDAWCPASRNTLMAGLHAGHTQLRGVGVLQEDSDQAPRYLPRRLQQAGYATALFGKWGLGDYQPPSDDGAVATGGRPSHLGFDEFVGHMKHRDAHTFTLPPYPQQPGDPRIHNKIWQIDEQGETVESSQVDVPYLPDVYLAEALDFIDRHLDTLFFLYLPTALPHAEYYLPPEDPAWAPYLDEQGQSLFPEIPWTGNLAFRRPVPAPKATFAAMVTRMDTQVGAVVDHLESVGLAERTLVLFISDNGPAEDGGFESPLFFNSSGGLRDFKLSLYEGGIRVPMIAYWPGTISPAVSSVPLALWDLTPTLLELAGADMPPDLDGFSMVPLLLGDEAGQPRHDVASPLYWETFNWIYRSQAARLGRFKAVRRSIVDARDAVELYDLEADRAETTNLAGQAQHCGTLIELKALMNGAHTFIDGNPEVPALALDCAFLFADGFESGDLSAWSGSRR